MSPNSILSVNPFDKFSFRSRLLFFAIVLLGWPFSGFTQTHAQPELPTAQLTIGGKTIRAEIADEENERATGLMFRKSLAPDSGMLFVMANTGPVAFWMKNTEVPLTIAYIAPNGMIMELHDLKPRDETPVSSRFPQIAFALEMPLGWFEKNNIWAGQRVDGLPAAGGK